MSLAFDATYYQTARPDVFDAFVQTQGSTGLTWAAFAEQHYNTFGWLEGSDPSASFDTSYYLQQNVDVAAAGVNPFQHFLNFGSLEDRAPFNGFPTIANGQFVPATYAAANTDLAAAGITTDAQLYQHFVIFGQFESRPGTPTVDTPSGGSTFTLTTAIDNITGTSGDDTIIGDAATASVADQIDGGTGTDTVRLFGNAAGPTTTAVEIFELNGNTAGFDLSSTSDATTLNLIDPTTAQTYTIANGQAVSISTVAGGEVVDIAGNTVTGLGVTLSGFGTAAANATLDLNSTAQTSLALTAGETTSGVTLLNTGTALTTVTVGGTGSLDVTTALTTITTFDASGNSGGVDLDGIGASVLAFTGGSGNDSVSVAGSYTTADVLNGGDGTDTLIINIAEADPAAVQTNVTNFEVVAIADDASNDEVDASRFSVNQVAFNADSATAPVVSGITTGATISLGTGVTDFGGTTAADINLSDAAGAGDALILDINNTTGAGNIDVDITGVETLTIDASGSDRANSVDLDAAQVSAITVLSGSGAGDNVTLTFGTGGTVVTSVDASGSTGSGGLVATLSAAAVTGATVTGTANVDTITGSSQADTITSGEGADVLNGGGGADTIILTETTAAADTVSFTVPGALNTTVNAATLTDFATTSDKLSFDGITITGGGAITATTGTAVTVGTVAAGALTDDTIYVINNGAVALTAAGTESIADYTDLTDVAAYLAEGYTSTADDDAAVFVINDLAGDRSYIYLLDEQTAGASTIQAADLALIGIVDELNDAAVVAGDIA
jgi:hypothetical protein